MRTSAFVPMGPHYPNGVVKKVVRKGTEPKVSTRITFFSHNPTDELEFHRARAGAAILNDHLRETLRELLGGTYGASAFVSNMAPLPGYTTGAIAFGSSPENVDKLVAASMEEVKKLIEQGPSAADVQKQQEVERRELEVGIKQNAYWTSSLQTLDSYGWDPRRIAKRRERIDLLNPANIQETFKKYFPLDHYSLISLLPQAASAGAAKPDAKPGAATKGKLGAP